MKEIQIRLEMRLVENGRAFVTLSIVLAIANLYEGSENSSYAPGHTHSLPQFESPVPARRNF